MKNLKTKSSRRRGAGLELAMMLFLAMTAVTILVVNATMIQVDKQKQSYDDLTEVVNEIDKMQIDQLSKSFVIYMDNYFDYASGAFDGNGLPNVDLEFNIMEPIFEGGTQKNCVVSFISKSSQATELENEYEQIFLVSIFKVVYTNEGPEEGVTELKNSVEIKFDVVKEDGKTKYQTYTIITED